MGFFTSVAVCLNLGHNRKYLLVLILTGIANCIIIGLNLYLTNLIFGPLLTTGKHHFITTAWLVLIRNIDISGVSFDNPSALLPEVGKGSLQKKNIRGIL